MATILTPEEFRQRFGDEALSQFSQQPQQQVQQRPGFLSRVGTRLESRGEELAEDIREAPKEISPKTGFRLGLRTTGALAGGIFDIFTEGIKSILGGRGTEKSERSCW